MSSFIVGEKFVVGGYQKLKLINEHTYTVPSRPRTLFGCQSAKPKHLKGKTSFIGNKVKSWNKVRMKLEVGRKWVVGTK